MPVRVAKVGGSLFSLPQLPTRLMQWLNTEPRHTTFLVAGGGKLADHLRQLDRRFQLAPPVAHRLAIRTMGIHGELLASLLQLKHPIGHLNDARSWLAAGSRASTCVLDPETFLQDDTPTGTDNQRLPCGWHVTSDSIAAHFARRLPADELVLLKSSLPTPPGNLTYGQATATDLVDPYFPTAAQGIDRVQVVNLRDPSFPRIQLVAD